MNRQVNVAKAYIAGLERDRRDLFALQQRYDELVWEAIQTATYAKALHMALHDLYTYTSSGGRINWERIEDLLEADRRTYHDVWSCECGHHKWDHDESGKCEYLACRHICGRSSDE